MPSRITRKSTRPRASDRSMVDTVQPPRLPVSETDRRRRYSLKMKLLRWNNARPQGSQRKKQNREPRIADRGWKSTKVSPLPVEGEIFFLTFPFIDPLYRSGDFTTAPRWDGFRIADDPPRIVSSVVADERREPRLSHVRVSGIGHLRPAIGPDRGYMTRRGHSGYIRRVTRPVATSAAAQTKSKLNHALRRRARPSFR